MDDSWDDPATKRSAEILAQAPDLFDSISRIKKADKVFNKLAFTNNKRVKEMSLQNVVTILNTYPIRNEMTVYMVVMDPGSSKPNQYLYTAKVKRAKHR